MTLFIKLLLAHLIGDFMLQPTKWVIHKEANKVKSKYLYLHTLVHFLLIVLLLWDIGYWKLALVISVSHFVIDLLKLYASNWIKKKSVLFFTDQAFHLIVLYICAYNSNLVEHTVVLLRHINWALITAVVFVTYPAAVVMGKLLEGFSDQIQIDHKSLPNAGKYIGIIERLFVLLFIIIGRWEVIGLLITAKSVFRFNDLKESNNRKLTEYILIGTLLSFGIAILTGFVFISLQSGL
ncbi:hypothetical protein SB49_05660 [Sediminicola sp. YIK13]|uniref:DUF3307 domain-containing protein n=1 Tax=Sediminicola sp. YIK13 TaxID=1453352 RepID=UPI00071F7582|nr:DUF3307 domain-containing protein [Sediminicola sp. YIK13]ALM07340.1 hypothetical protein SB49_05660 [Sediminicola sp. YIK13]